VTELSYQLLTDVSLLFEATTDSTDAADPFSVQLSEDISSGDSEDLGEFSGDGSGLIIGIVLAAVVTGLCAGVVLCRMRSRRRKSKYIAFGNPSYNREHVLPAASDLNMDHSLSLSSNGYTVLA